MRFDKKVAQTKKKCKEVEQRQFKHMKSNLWLCRKAARVELKALRPNQLPREHCWWWMVFDSIRDPTSSTNLRISEQKIIKNKKIDERYDKSNKYARRGIEIDGHGEVNQSCANINVTNDPPKTNGKANLQCKSGHVGVQCRFGMVEAATESGEENWIKQKRKTKKKKSRKWNREFHHWQAIKELLLWSDEIKTCVMPISGSPPRSHHHHHHQRENQTSPAAGSTHRVAASSRERAERGPRCRREWDRSCLAGVAEREKTQEEELKQKKHSNMKAGNQINISAIEERFLKKNTIIQSWFMVRTLICEWQIYLFVPVWLRTCWPDFSL